jgi:hypothetical protein
MTRLSTHLATCSLGVLAMLATCATLRADFKLVENWDTMPTGSPDGLACTGVMGGVWDTEVATTGNVVVEDNSGSRVCRVANLTAGGGRAFGFNNINTPIASGGAGKVFFRFMVRSDSLVPRAYVGLISDTTGDPITGTNTNGQAGFCVGFGMISDGASGYNLVKTDGTTVLKTGFAKGKWYNAWVIVDHSAETFDLYVSDAAGPAGAPTMPTADNLLASAVPFGAANPDPINGMIFTSPNGTPQASRTYIDEIYWDGDQGLQPTARAKNASPAPGSSDVIRDTNLGWTAGPHAASHDVYFGTHQADVEAATRTAPLGVLASQGQTATMFDPAGLLAFGQTYYWRVDEVNAAPDSTITKGSVWNFTCEPYSYPLKAAIKATASSSMAGFGPEKTVDGSGLNSSDQHSILSTDMWISVKGGAQPVWIQYEFDNVYVFDRMWVWNSNQAVEQAVGFGAKDVAIETSEEGTTWTAVTNIPEFNQATGTADYVHNTTVSLNGARARYIKLTIKATWGGQSASLSEVRFFYVPTQAYSPSPASAATGVALDATLNWRPGRFAARHEVYLAADANSLAKAGSLVKTTPSHSLALAGLGLEYGRTYAWKVNEVNDTATPKVWEGGLWTFTTTPYAVIDDFEAYDDTCSRIFFSWVDGFGYSASPGCSVAASGGNGTGSTVGNINPPFAEQSIVNSGRQSMPMNYDNSKSPFYSETQRQWSTPQVWAAGGANTLSVSFRGVAAAFLETSPGTIVMSGMGTDIYNAADQGRFAYKPLSGDGSIVARVQDLGNANVWSKAGVMIRETLNESSAWAYVVYGGTNGVHYQARLTANAAATTDSTLTLPPDQTGARAPVWVKVERKGNQFNGYYATEAANPVWKPMLFNPQTIPMASNVYIGLAVTSHAAGVPCGARFTSVATTGSVSGGWQTQDWGVSQPTGGNSPETFYVAVQDSSGKVKVVSNPDAVAIATGVWTKWDIPLSDISSGGVNLSSVTKVTIGVGDRNSPKSGSAGKVYIDDIRLTRTEK